MAESSPAPITPAPSCNLFAIRSAARHATAFYDGHLAPTGLRTSQFSLLSTLDRSGPLAIGSLASRMATDRTTMGRALRPLERDGLVAIAPGRDGRTRALDLTEAGRGKLAEARPLWAAAQAAFESRFGATEAASLRSALARVREVV